jgi:hypothetical protein
LDIITVLKIQRSRFGQVVKKDSAEVKLKVATQTQLHPGLKGDMVGAPENRVPNYLK